MEFFKEVLLIIKTIFQSLKNIARLIKQKKWLDAGKEIWICCKNLYTGHIKGRYINVKGKHIPMGIIITLLVVVLTLFVCLFSEDVAPVAPDVTEQKTADVNTYDKDGIKIYGMETCGEAACGTLENQGQQTMEEIVITVKFYAEDGIAVCKSTATATTVVPTMKASFSVPCEIDFSTFKLTDVVVKEAED